MRLKKVTAGLTGAALMLALAGTAVAGGAVDDASYDCGNTCTTQEAFAGIYAGGVANADAESMMGQTFTAGLTGQLSRIEFQVGHLTGEVVGPTPTTLPVWVLGTTNGVPDTTKALWTDSLDVATAFPAPGDTAWVIIDLPAGVQVTKGGQYAIVIGPTEAGVGGNDHIWMTWEGDAPGGLTDGEAYAASRNLGGAWTWGTLAREGTTDLAFRTQVIPDPTPNPTTPPTDSVMPVPSGEAGPGLLGVLAILAVVSGTVVLTAGRSPRT